MNDTRSFIGCAITTEVAFAGSAFMGNMRSTAEQAGVLRKDDIVFSVLPPNQTASASPTNPASYSIAVPRAHAGPFYEAQGGSVFKVNGVVRFAESASGHAMWAFAVVSFEPLDPDGTTDGVAADDTRATDTSDESSEPPTGTPSQETHEEAQ